MKSGEWVRGLKISEGQQATAPFVCTVNSLRFQLASSHTTSRKITQPVPVSQPFFLTSFVQFRVKLGVRVRVLKLGYRVYVKAG